jgi:ATP phosphoribosyltransferase regulatory subunit
MVPMNNNQTSNTHSTLYGGPNVTLLPAGFYDILPPQAEHLERIRRHFIDHVCQFGYTMVTPPLMEFESSLLAGNAHTLATHTFRVMDPISHQMMGIRSDMTQQVVRMAQHRLNDHPLPLRLSYAGMVARTQSHPLYPERQLLQAGIELIGCHPIHGETEIMTVSLSTLMTLGLDDLHLDISTPFLWTPLLDRLKAYPNHQLLVEAINQKQPEYIRSYSLDPDLREACLLLLQPTNQYERLQRAATLLNINEHITPYLAQLEPALRYLRSHFPQVSISFDWLEHQGFNYHNGIAFAVFSKKHSIEIARGGRYHVQTTDAPYEAIGCSIYLHRLAHLIPYISVNPRLLVPLWTDYTQLCHWHQQAYQTIWSRCNQATVEEAIERQCSHWFDGHIIHQTAS